MKKFKVDEPLKRYTYTKTGGNADFYITPTKNEEVQAGVKCTIKMRSCYIFRKWLKYYYP